MTRRGWLAAGGLASVLVVAWAAYEGVQVVRVSKPSDELRSRLERFAANTDSRLCTLDSANWVRGLERTANDINKRCEYVAPEGSQRAPWMSGGWAWIAEVPKAVRLDTFVVFATVLAQFLLVLIRLRPTHGLTKRILGPVREAFGLEQGLGDHGKALALGAFVVFGVAVGAAVLLHQARVVTCQEHHARWRLTTRFGKDCETELSRQEKAVKEGLAEIVKAQNLEGAVNTLVRNMKKVATKDLVDQLVHDTMNALRTEIVIGPEGLSSVSGSLTSVHGKLKALESIKKDVNEEFEKTLRTAFTNKPFEESFDSHVQKSLKAACPPARACPPAPPCTCGTPTCVVPADLRGAIERCASARSAAAQPDPSANGTTAQAAPARDTPAKGTEAARAGGA